MSVLHCGSCVHIKNAPYPGRFVCERDNMPIKPSDLQCISHVLAPAEREIEISIKVNRAEQMGMFG